MKPWLFGNTTVRNPLRLRDGLRVLRYSAWHGNLRGKEADCAFYQLLGVEGIVDPKGDETCSISRKWRSALAQMGFLYPKLQGQLSSLQSDLGAADTITPNGERLLQNDTLGGWQACLLRALAGCYLPSAVEPKHDCPVFSPLRHVLGVMLALQQQTHDAYLSFIEMAVFIQCTSSATAAQQLATDIVAFRAQREAATSKRKFDDAALLNAQQQAGVQADSLKDYADTNLRYLKATGLFLRKGRGIAFAPEKLSVIHALAQETAIPATPLALLQSLSNGAALPTDEVAGAWEDLHDVIAELNRYGEQPVIPADVMHVADIASVTATLQAALDKLKETEYARQQAGQISDIVDYLTLLTKRNRKLTRKNEELLEIPSSEAPAYFEWAVWRAFLAINSLVKPAWEARRFAIDRDFLPVSTAPGNGADMVFEFDDMVLVVEVTLTASSRQEAAESEPVRRHVAQVLEQYQDTNKQVFGLFIAVHIDTNTANTFKLGEWYLKDDRKLDLHIIPLALADFSCLLEAFADKPNDLLQHLKLLLRDCRMYANKDAPEWKQKIAELAQQLAEKQQQC